MKMQWSSEQVRQFMMSYPEFQGHEVEGDHPIWIVEIDGQVRVVLDVGEDIGRDELIQAIPRAIEWRKRLEPFPDGHAALMRDLHNQQSSNRDVSYRMLADNINQQITEHVRLCAEYYSKATEAWSRAQRTKKLAREYPDWYQGYYREFDAAHHLVKAMHLTTRDLDLPPPASELRRGKHLTHTEIQTYICEAVNRVVAGELPFEPGYPISEHKIREQLDYWRTKLGRSKSQQKGQVW